ncbi:MAG TPA: LCP family protein, partial [Bacilli bacterium]|nr:LCP family protein [Bacilli bacterium]
KKFKAWIKIVINVISVIVIGMFAIIFFYINRTYDFMDKITSKNTITEKYYVMVKKECEYTDIRDLVNDSVGTYDEKIELYKKAIKKFNSLVDAKLVKYDAVDSMAKDLLNDKVKAIIISAAHKDTIDTDLDGFMDNTRILYTIEIEIRVDKAVKHSNVNVTKDTFNIFLSGMDAYGNVSSRGRSDVNMIITVNPNTNEILLTSIPRDYYVQLHGTTGNKDKLTHAGFYGTEMSINTIQDFLGIKFDYYVKVNFSTLINIVDIIGGVDVYSDKSFKPWTNGKIYINKGMVHMDGATALAFARERHAYLEGDRHRVQNQQDVITAIINKLTSSTELLTKYTSLLNSVSNSLDTNIDMKNITSLNKLQLNKKPTWTIKKYSLNGTDSYNYTYTYGNQQLYVMNPMQDTINTARTYINGIMDGKTFSQLGIN